MVMHSSSVDVPYEVRPDQLPTKSPGVVTTATTERATETPCCAAFDTNTDAKPLVLVSVILEASQASALDRA